VTQLGLGRDRVGTVRFLGPPNRAPRRQWQGPKAEALDRLSRLPDDAGLEAFWAAFAA
jgi:hypothetical protein